MFANPDARISHVSFDFLLCIISIFHTRYFVFTINTFTFHFTFHSSILFSPHSVILIVDLYTYALHNLSSIIYHTQEFNSHTRIAYP